MIEPNALADELIRRSYADASMPDFDVSAGLADMHTRIKESGLLSTPAVDPGADLGLGATRKSRSR